MLKAQKNAVLLVSLVVVTAFLGLGQRASARGRQIPVTAPVGASLEKMVEATMDLHVVLYKQEEQRATTKMQALISEIDATLKVINSEVEIPTHMIKPLESAKGFLQEAMNSSGSDQRNQLEEGFRQIVQIIQTYELSKKYRTYWCETRKTMWVQRKAGKARNPFEPKTKSRCSRIYY